MPSRRLLFANFYAKLPEHDSLIYDGNVLPRIMNNSRRVFMAYYKITTTKRNKKRNYRYTIRGRFESIVRCICGRYRIIVNLNIPLVYMNWWERNRIFSLNLEKVRYSEEEEDTN